MLDEMTIDSLGVIHRTRMDFSPGLTAITGETGAGKTMVLTGMSLLLGAKADPATVRVGAQRAVVEGRVTAVSDDVVRIVEEVGGYLDDDGALIISRTVAAAGRSRTHLAGRSVPQQTLADVAQELVTIHGQSDQIRLKSPARQRAALDEFAGEEFARVLKEYRTAWFRRAELVAQLDGLVTQRDERAREAELLRMGLAEVERVEPVSGEDIALAAEAARLSNVQLLRDAAHAAHMCVAGGDIADGGVDELTPVTELLDRAARVLHGVEEHDAELGRLAGRVDEIRFAVDDVVAELSAHTSTLEADPARLEWVEQRRSELHGLTRAYGESVDAVLAWAADAGLRLMELEDDGERIESLRVEVEQVTELLGELANDMTTRRRGAARDLADAVTSELAGLAMGGARFDVDVSTNEELGAYGRDDVVMLLTPHQGAPARPLGRGASGGELSRVMLALEVALATASTSGARGVPTMIFDEVDAGVGGKAAIEVGRRLARLAQTFQVIVVTHLPQVAAFADHHVVVTKSSGQDVSQGFTQSDVREVVGDERVVELARMLSGQDESDAALEHAKELLDIATVRL